MNELSEQERIFRGIKADLALKGVTFADIAKKIDRSRQTVRHVAKGTSRKAFIRQAIAEAIERDPWDSTTGKDRL